MTIDLILKDAVTYTKMMKNKNYKERLEEAYRAVKNANIKSYEEFKNCNIGIGAFEFTEITIFDRLDNEDYYRALNSYYLELQSAFGMQDDYGDRLASWGTLGETPYRDELKKKGYI